MENRRAGIDLLGKIQRMIEPVRFHGETKRQAQLDPSVLTENLKEAMKLAVHCADVRFVINPAQRETLNREMPNLQLNWPNVKHVELTDDPAVAAGGVRIFTRHGELDAQIDVQLDRVVADLMPPAETV